MARLGDLCGDRDNNLNLIRMAAAVAVVVSHAWPVTLGVGTAEPLEGWLGLNLGAVAVHVFFAISGFLVAQSFVRAPGPGDWLLARVLRLFPALVVVVAACALLLGPGVSRFGPGDYLSDPSVGGYILRNATLVRPQWTLPGVFEGLPYPGVVNGPIWTLLPEVLCYLGLLVLGLAGALGPGRRMAAALGLYAVMAMAAGPAGLVEALPRLGPILELSLPFVLGVACFRWRRRIVLSPLLLVPLVLGAVAAGGSVLFLPLFDVALGYAVLLLGFLPGGAVRRYNRLGDYSYGLYLTAFPVQQLAVWSGAATPAANIAVALPVATALAVLSWHLVERPALSLRRRGAGRVLSRPASP